MWSRGAALPTPTPTLGSWSAPTLTPTPGPIRNKKKTLNSPANLRRPIEKKRNGIVAIDFSVHSFGRKIFTLVIIHARLIASTPPPKKKTLWLPDHLFLQIML